MNYTTHDYSQSELAYKEFLRPSLQQAVDLLDIQGGFKILDAGCGPGAMFSYFAEKLNSTGIIYGIDASDIHLEAAHQIVKTNNFEKIVSLKNVNLFEDLPFENDYFDIIWLSDVLFPDDFGEQIYPTLKALYKILKPGGRIGIFYGNWLRLELLPGYTTIEHYISIANEKRKSSEFPWKPEVHPENAFRWLNECGFISCENKYVSTYYQSPLQNKTKNYLHYHLTQIYGKAIEFRLADFHISQTLIDEFHKITNLKDPEYILYSPFYHCAIHGQLTIGHKKPIIK